MSRRRRIELGLAALGVVIAGAIALLVAPLPPLARATSPSEGWARGIEFGALVFVLWMAFGAVGLMQAKISVGLDGVSAERSGLDELSEDAARQVRDATRSLAENVQLLAGKVEVLLDVQRQTVRRVDELYREGVPSGRASVQIDDDVGGTPAPSGGSE